MQKGKVLFYKYKEYVLYLVFGVITSIVNYGVFVLCRYVFGFSASLSNIFAWILAVLAAYVTNKLWVFESKSREIKVIAKELGEFALARVLTGAIETGLIWFFVDHLGQNALVWKIITSVIVVVLNYIFSKFIIFKKEK